MWDVTEPWGIRNPDDIKHILNNTTLSFTQKKEQTKAFGVRPTEVTLFNPSYAQICVLMVPCDTECVLEVL